jgi:hypothetical protein
MAQPQAIAAHKKQFNPSRAAEARPSQLQKIIVSVHASI